jgi:hypothetical protein
VRDYRPAPSQAANSVVSRRLRICRRNAAIWFQLGMLWDVSFFEFTEADLLSAYGTSISSTLLLSSEGSPRAVARTVTKTWAKCEEDR